ncbi:hypothetical protein CROQUDRAFT_650626 [Cronartium quercuum f. sp. fusiforme G11]|uniref:ABC transporter domain-containing protein n=1 Tax=Cronartium quercuum f. sp. fusiforme G11 TaxID=708437 RepID=A0A9P6NYW8_9BASI|nr:hypothetical protein CROQUDRAFT_650626 [Cronartium quercuum f. sp. fusiforme G11]
MILGQSRVDPTGSIRYPLIDHLNSISATFPNQPTTSISLQNFFKLVRFNSRLEIQGSNNGFTDYTARYHGIRPEDRRTLRDLLWSGRLGVLSEKRISEIAGQLDLHQFIDLPLITLSNGQCRRASIAQALLSGEGATCPQVLILEEPYTGLDEGSRKDISALLKTLHNSRRPRIILVLRPQDPIASFVTHALVLSQSRTDPPSKRIRAQGEVAQISKVSCPTSTTTVFPKPLRNTHRSNVNQGKDLVRLRNINIRYETRSVWSKVNWTIQEGDRWMLSGPNGSGKSTLLSLVLGDHPRSFTEDIELFGRPRVGQATSQIQSAIGHVSPEIFNSFPRKHGESALTVLDVIVTGFESVFSYRPLSNPRQEALLKRLLQEFDHSTLLTQNFLVRNFAELSAGEQSLVLLLRALVKEPSLVIADEPFAGMDQQTLQKSRDFLTHRLRRHQALVIVSHYTDELPSCVNKRLHLQDGQAKELSV